MSVHLFVIVTVLLLCGSLKNKSRKKHVALPISMLIIGFFVAIHYDYGLDYWNYYDIFYYDRDYPNRHGDVFFWTLMFSFNRYYQFIIFYGAFLSLSVWFIINKYVNEDYYWLFFLIFLIHPSLFCNMTYACRSAFASCLIWYGLARFYFDRYRLIPLVAFILFSSMFHRSVSVLLILPIIDILLKRLSPKFVYLSLVFILLLGSPFSAFLFSKLTTSFVAFENFEHYGDDRIGLTSLIMIASRAIHLIPAYYIVHYLNDRSSLSKFCVLAVIYYCIYFLGLDMLGRFTMLLYIFVIIASLKIIKDENFFKKCLIMFPSVLFALQRCIQFYIEMYTTYILSPGNMLVYKSIFDIAELP